MNEALLTSLSSAGLVRRARKALEKSQPHMQEHRFTFEGHQGQLDWQHPLSSRCDCGASGLCKHLVAVALHLLEPSHPLESGNEEPAKLDLHLAALLDDAGKTQVRRLYQQSQRRWATEIKLEKNTVCVGIEGHQLYFRRLQTLQDIICTQEAQRYALLAVWIYCREQKITFAWPQWLVDEQARQESVEQQSRADLQARLHKLLTTLASIGIDRLRTASLVELECLVVQMERHRLSVTPLKQLHGTLEKYLLGQGIRDRQAVLSCLARGLAALEGVQDHSLSTPSSPPERLLGLGAYPWQTESGTQGMTQVLQDEQGRWISLSESRKSAPKKLNFEQLYAGHALLEGAPSALGWQGQTWMLLHAELNAWGRVRRLQKTRVYPSTQPLEPVALCCASEIDWQQEYLCFQPSGFYHSQFNTANQCMELEYWDQEQQRVRFALPYTQLSQKAIIHLERLGTALPELIIARIERSASHIFLRPISLRREKKWINLFFDPVPQATDQQLFAQSLAHSAHLTPDQPRLTLLQQSLHGMVEALADGVPAPRPELAEQAQRLGLMTLAQLLQGGTPVDYLRAAYCAEQLLKLCLIKPIDQPQ